MGSPYVPSLLKGGVLIWIQGSDTAAFLMVASVSCRAKAPCLGAGDDDTHGCHALLEDVVVVLLSVSGLQMKTFVRMDSATAMLCAFLPLGGVVVELRCAMS